MKIYAALGLAALMTGFGVAGAHAQGSIYVYNFNDGDTANPANTTNLFTVDRVNQNASATGSRLTSNFDPANITSFSGTTVNADNGDTAGSALALQGGTASTTTPTTYANNGGYLQATANLTGFQNIGFSFAGQRTTTGFTNDQFQYSLNGTDFTNFGPVYNPNPTTNGGFATQSFDLSSIAGLNNNANAAFRLTLDGATSAGGNNRFDNLIISGTAGAGTPITAPVPEASTTVSLGLMLALGGLAFAVKKKKASVSL